MEDIFSHSRQNSRNHKEETNKYDHTENYTSDWQNKYMIYKVKRHILGRIYLHPKIINKELVSKICKDCL